MKNLLNNFQCFSRFFKTNTTKFQIQRIPQIVFENWLFEPIISNQNLLIAFVALAKPIDYETCHKTVRNQSKSLKKQAGNGPSRRHI